jgi:putative ABC transport system permease protein
MLLDLRLAIRSLIHNPRFSLVAILTLAVGIGAATAIFSVCDWTLFRGYRSPPDVYAICGRNDQTPFSPIRFEYQVRAYEQQKTAFSEYALSAWFTDNVVINGEPVSTSWRGIDANLLPLLGIKPHLGRNFMPDECQDGHNDVVILNYNFWQKHFEGKPDVLGKQIRVGSALCTIVGVLPGKVPNYLFSEAYRPLVFRTDPKDPGRVQYNVFARIRPGVSQAQALESLESLKLDQPAELKWWVTNDHAVVTNLSELNKGDHRDVYWIMIAAVGFLYAIACLNASNLVLIRMFGQRREYSIRLALGSSRPQIVWRLILDSLLLNCVAAAVGILLANVLTPMLFAVAGNSFMQPKWMEWNVSWRSLAVLSSLSLVSACLVTLLPAFRVLRGDLQLGLKDAGNITGESRALARIRGLFVIIQAALAVLLLSGAGLMIQTFRRLAHVDIGFDPTHKAKMFVSYPAHYSTETQTRLQLLRKIQDELIHIPGVVAAAFGSDLLLSNNDFTSQSIEGPNGQHIQLSMLGFGANFPEVSGISLTQGEWLTSTSKNSVLINESLARKLFPDRSAIGQFVRPTSHRDQPADWKGWQVVGVIHDLPENMRDRPAYHIYTPETWFPAGFYCFVLKLSQPLSDELGGRIRKQLYSFDPNIMAEYIESLEDARTSNLWAESLANAVLKILAIIALLLTVVGIYAVLAFTVDRRMNEFGVRVALGATRRDLVSLVAHRSIGLTAIGLVAGLVISYFLGRVLQSLLFKTTPQDPVVLIAVCALMLIASALACIWPCRRAASVEVAHLLRSQ